MSIEIPINGDVKLYNNEGLTTIPKRIIEEKGWEKGTKLTVFIGEDGDVRVTER